MDKLITDVFGFLKSYNDAIAIEIELSEIQLEKYRFCLSWMGKKYFWNILKYFNSKMIFSIIRDIENILAIMKLDASEYIKIQCALIAGDYPTIIAYIESIKNHLIYFEKFDNNMALRIYKRIPYFYEKIKDFASRLTQLENSKYQN